MDSIKTASRIHPLMAAAAVSVIALSGLGIAAITGVLPTSHGTSASPPDSTVTVASNSGSAPAVAGSGMPVNTNNAPPPPPNSATGSQAPIPGAVATCSACGTIEAVRTVQHQAKPSGVGAVAGALLGGVIGNRFGGGNGRVLTTVGGAVGGGIAGNEIEKHTHTSTSYLIEVRMENGKLRSFPSANQPGWNVGDQVKVVNGKLTGRG